jgi:NADPH-dependent glutamate synthase beta subunit-like oxidoreductase
MTIQPMEHVAIVAGGLSAATVVANLRAHGAEPVGEVERYEDSYQLCHVRGPAGIIVELAERIG